MELTESAAISNAISKSICKSVVQISFVNAPITRAFLEKGASVTWYTKAKFNPFSDNSSVTLCTRNPNTEGSVLTKRNKSYDAVYIAGVQDFLSARILISVWMPLVRRGGFLFFSNANIEDVDKAINEYLQLVGEYVTFKIEKHATPSGLFSIQVR